MRVHVRVRFRFHVRRRHSRSRVMRGQATIADRRYQPGTARHGDRTVTPAAEQVPGGPRVAGVKDGLVGVPVAVANALYDTDVLVFVC